MKIHKLGFDEYIRFARNMQLKFILGYDIHSKYTVTPEAYERVKSLVDQGKLTIAISGGSMEAVYTLLGIDPTQVGRLVPSP